MKRLIFLTTIVLIVGLLGAGTAFAMVAPVDSMRFVDQYGNPLSTDDVPPSPCDCGSCPPECTRVYDPHMGSICYKHVARGIQVTPLDAGTETIVNVETGQLLSNFSDGEADHGWLLGFSFESIGSDGTAAISLSPDPSHPLPRDYWRVSNEFDISKSFSGTGTVTLTFGNWGAPEFFSSNTRMLHYNGVGWEDVTVSIDTTNKTVTGRSNSLSPFILAVPAPATGINNNMLLLLALFGVGSGYIIRYRLSRS